MNLNTTAIKLDEDELGRLLSFLRQSEGRVCGVIVPGPLVGDAIINRIQGGLTQIPIHIAQAEADPPVIGELSRSLSMGEVVLIVRRDSIKENESEQNLQDFWERLNLQRESLAAGKIRTVLLLNAENERELFRSADDLLQWMMLFRFQETVLADEMKSISKKISGV